jgi:uncharacterized membrane protein YhfC
LTIFNIVVTNFPNYADHPWLFGMYGGMAAGLFEEMGRFLLFTRLLKKYHDYRSGISFGIGWGGIEAIVLMLAAMVPNILFSFMINAGTLETELAGQIPEDQLASILKSLSDKTPRFSLKKSLRSGLWDKISCFIP